MPVALENQLMQQHGLKYSEARQVVVQGRQRLGMPKAGPWTEELRALCFAIVGGTNGTTPSVKEEEEERQPTSEAAPKTVKSNPLSKKTTIKPLAASTMSKRQSKAETSLQEIPQPADKENNHVETTTPRHRRCFTEPTIVSPEAPSPHHRRSLSREEIPLVPGNRRFSRVRSLILKQSDDFSIKVDKDDHGEPNKADDSDDSTEEDMTESSHFYEEVIVMEDGGDCYYYEEVVVEDHEHEYVQEDEEHVDLGMLARFANQRI